MVIGGAGVPANVAGGDGAAVRPVLVALALLLRRVLPPRPASKSVPVP